MAAPRDVMLRLARKQRANSVTAEAVMWQALRGRRLNGHKFRRQVPLGQYIADFVCFGSRLIVEIDGPSHAIGAQQARDATRDDWFVSEGFLVVRLANELVIGSPQLAVQRVAQALEASAFAAPHPTPLARGHLLPQGEKDAPSVE